VPIPVELDRIAAQVVDACFQVHSRLGPGLLEHAGKRLGFLVNFNKKLIKEGIQRIAH
jgi:hypothetical protein